MIVPESRCSRFSLRWSFSGERALNSCRQQLNVTHQAHWYSVQSYGVRSGCLSFLLLRKRWTPKTTGTSWTQILLQLYWGKGIFYVWTSKCSGEDNQLSLYKLQANVKCFLWDPFSYLSTAVLRLIRLLSVLDTSFITFLSSFVC